MLLELAVQAARAAAAMEQPTALLLVEMELLILAAAAVAEYQTVVALVVLAVQGAVALEAVRQTPEVDRQVLQIPAAVAVAVGILLTA